MKRTIITILVAVISLLTFAGCNNTASKSSTIIEKTTEVSTEKLFKGKKLSIQYKKVEGPSGIETYFNEDMSEIIKKMKKGFIGKYWVRKDGVKMFGEYILCKCRYNSNSYHPNMPVGTVIPTTLGEAIVCSNDVCDNEDICISVIW